MAEPAASKADFRDIAARLWETADDLRANSHLKSGALRHACSAGDLKPRNH
ncbi:MAG TPA: hypothetical protein VNI34_07300 [Candidatus Nitrosotalea sp.]|nr:hypothetical protein [Candidatus Nitrosotalea sp.]